MAINNIRFYADGGSTTIGSFKVLKAVNGFVSSQEPFTAAGKSLVLRTDLNRDFIKIVLTSDDIVQIASDLENKVEGLRVIVNGVSPNRTLVFKTSGSIIEVKQTEGADALGIPVGSTSVPSSFEQIGTEPFVSGTSEYSFEDPVGASEDTYRIVTVNTDTSESSGPIFRAVDNCLNICILEGKVVSMSGAEPLKNALITCKARIQTEDDPDPKATDNIFDDILVSGDKFEVLTDEFGQWRLDLPAGVRFFLEIPTADHGNFYCLPDQFFCAFADLLPDRGWTIQTII